MKTSIILCLCLCFYLASIRAQTVQFSPAQKIGQYNHFNVVGSTSNGVLVHQFGKSGHILELYNNANMTMVWRKPFPLSERTFDVVDIDTYNDTLKVCYTYTVMDKEYLKYQMFNIDMVPLLAKPIVLDSFKSAFTENNNIDVSYHITRKYALIYTDVHDFSESYAIPYIIIDNRGHIISKQTVKVNSDFKSPSLSDAFVYDNNGYPAACFVYGDYTLKNSRNDYPFSKYGATFTGTPVEHFVFKENDNALSSGDYKWDYVQNRLVICGIYAGQVGNAALGTFYGAIKPDEGVVVKKFVLLSRETDIQINGDASHQKTPEVINYKVKGITLRNDGGCILQCEQIYQTTETFRSTQYSFYGVSNPTTLNFYHYDDILIVSFSPEGQQLWTKVLHKKQETEGDGGYYLSYAESIGEKNIYFFYNDGVVTNATFSNYVLGPEGSVERHELFNNERKSVMMIPQFGKQISYNEIVVPSIRKNMLQFIKFVL